MITLRCDTHRVSLHGKLKVLEARDIYQLSRLYVLGSVVVHVLFAIEEYSLKTKITFFVAGCCYF